MKERSGVEVDEEDEAWLGWAVVEDEDDEVGWADADEEGWVPVEAEGEVEEEEDPRWGEVEEEEDEDEEDEEEPDDEALGIAACKSGEVHETSTF